MLEEGIDPQRIDAVLERFGMPMGPLTLIDEVGIDVGHKVAKVMEDAYGSRMRVAGALGRLAGSDDALGRKTGRGIYVHDNGHKTVNPRAIELLEQSRHRDGVVARDLDDGQIVDRAVLIMVNEAARCLDEKVVDDPEALDLAMVMGTGFAPFRGGLLRYADERGIPQIAHRLETLADRFGDRFEPAPLITAMARKSRCFHAGEVSMS
jgi:3-hydroxyacyl-CoA dehydrogenase/enoyl-CoA hydratase/3-hydroxybutyryl-CoA epimerase